MLWICFIIKEYNIKVEFKSGKIHSFFIYISLTLKVVEGKKFLLFFTIPLINFNNNLYAIMRYILYLHRLSPYFILIILINCKSEISFKEGELFSNEVADFNFELSPDQIFSDISDLDFAYTQVFSQEQENGLQVFCLLW